MDIATRVYNHTWKIDPIVRSVLDTDFYKLLMLQTPDKLVRDLADYASGQVRDDEMREDAVSLQLAIEREAGDFRRRMAGVIHVQHCADQQKQNELEEDDCTAGQQGYASLFCRTAAQISLHHQLIGSDRKSVV